MNVDLIIIIIKLFDNFYYLKLFDNFYYLKLFDNFYYLKLFVMIILVIKITINFNDS